MAVSLHAPDDETRTRLMPANRKYNVAEVVEACKRYFERTGRRISFEYSMIDGVNDSLAQAEKLAQIAVKIGAHINLIPLNYVEEREFGPSKKENLKAFCRVLEAKGANYTIRRKLGGDVDASCGQLRRKRERAQMRGEELS